MPAEKTVWISDETHEELSRWSEFHKTTHGEVIQATLSAWRDLSPNRRRQYLEGGKAPAER